MDEYTTSKGDAVHVGDHFRDTRQTNVRTLRVAGLEGSYVRGKLIDIAAHCIVVRQEHDGAVTTPMRPTSMNAERLVTRSFARVEAP